MFENLKKTICSILAFALLASVAFAQEEGEASSSVEANVEKGLASSASGEKQLRFSFSYAPWKTVIDWLAREAGLSLTAETYPVGSFNLTDPSLHSVPDAIDTVNSVLLIKGFTLVRRGKMLVLVNLQDGIPPNLVSQVQPDDLDSLGEYELVSCLFELERMTPEDAEQELSKLLGPQGRIIVLEKSGQVHVTETGGKLRTIRRVINAVEQPSEKGSISINQLKLQHISAEEALVNIRQIMNIPDEGYASDDGSIRLSVDSLGTSLLVKAAPDAVAEIRDILKLVDVESAAFKQQDGAVSAPQIHVYPISNADPETVLSVLQTLLAGQPDCRLTIDPKSNSIVAQARVEQHQTIRATLDEMQSDYAKIEIFNLYSIDPATAKLAVESLFGIKSGEDSDAQANGPRVDVNLTTRQLLVRGTQAEIDRIDELLEKMGESGDGLPEGDRGNIRMLPIAGGSTQALLQRVMQVWPTMRQNRIRTVTPSAAVDAMKAYRQGENESELKSPEQPLEPEPDPVQPESTKPSVPKDARPALPRRSRRQPSRIGKVSRPEPLYLAQIAAPDMPLDGEPSASIVGLPEIVVAPGPGGLMIASEDKEALDAFEDLLNALSDPALFPEDNYSIYYLKYAKAEEAAKLLNTLVNGSSSDSAGDGGGGGGLADMFGFGGLLGSAGDALDSLSSSSSLKIIPDARVNALWIKGASEDVELIRQMLSAIDREGSPEDVQTTPVPRLIPVFNTSAAEIARVVRDVYASQLQEGQGQGGQGGRQQPDIRAVMSAMRGGRGGGGGGANPEESATKAPPLAIGVDTRSNSIVVSATDSVFQQIKALVNQLDEVAIESNETTKIVTVSRANPEQIQRALSSLFGGNATGPNNGNSNNSNANRPGAAPGSNRSSAEADAARRRADFFNAIQRMRGGRGGDTGGRGGRGGTGGGRGSGGGGGRSGGGGGRRGGGGR